MLKIGRTFKEDKIKEAVYTGKLETRWGEADVVLLGGKNRE